MEWGFTDKKTPHKDQILNKESLFSKIPNSLKVTGTEILFCILKGLIG